MLPLGLRLVFRAVGLGLGITALALSGVLLILQPVIVQEPNMIIRFIELACIGVGILSLLAETKR